MKTFGKLVLAILVTSANSAFGQSSTATGIENYDHIYDRIVDEYERLTETVVTHVARAELYDRSHQEAYRIATRNSNHPEFRADSPTRRLNEESSESIAKAFA